MIVIKCLHLFICLLLPVLSAHRCIYLCFESSPTVVPGSPEEKALVVNLEARRAWARANPLLYLTSCSSYKHRNLYLFAALLPRFWCHVDEAEATFT